MLSIITFFAAVSSVLLFSVALFWCCLYGANWVKILSSHSSFPAALIAMLSTLFNNPVFHVGDVELMSNDALRWKSGAVAE
ncbi:hypothetical protein RHGRI_034106 [Rhododendron griersonianum]|uniref:Uncharacterized protein n=1 Tax=Rhododendron griersonianum TaxID=479676 RepID=A0AAV6HZB1_9ERIC|nr:hypothetical protein RHGRI_034106 [Rhododendron griersonianum]